MLALRGSVAMMVVSRRVCRQLEAQQLVYHGTVLKKFLRYTTYHTTHNIQHNT